MCPALPVDRLREHQPHVRMQQLRELDGVLLVVEVVCRRRDAAEQLDHVGAAQAERRLGKRTDSSRTPRG